MVYEWTKLTFTANLGKRWCGFFSTLTRYAQMMSSEFKLEKLSILPNFYFREVFEQLKPNICANFHFERVLRFVIEYAWISELLRGAALTWQRGEMSCRLKNWLYVLKTNNMLKHLILQGVMAGWYEPLVSGKRERDWEGRWEGRKRGLGRVFGFPFSPHPPHPFPFLRQSIILGS